MITNHKINGADVAKLVSQIEEIVKGQDIARTAVACTIVTVFSQKPNISPEDLRTAVQGISEWLTAFLGTGVVH